MDYDEMMSGTESLKRRFKLILILLSVDIILVSALFVYLILSF